MADWYVSSAAYAGYTAFQASHAYTIGDIIVPTAPALAAKWVFRCTTSGTSSTEPAWNAANNGTSTSGSATFTNITGQSSFGWSAAAGDLPTLNRSSNNRVAAGDRVYLSSDHSETQTATTIHGAQVASYTPIQFLSVNRGGSVPPVAADLTAGATCIVSGLLSFSAIAPSYHYGITYEVTSTSGMGGNLTNTNNKTIFFDTCTLYLNTASAVSISTSGSSSFPPGKWTLLNSTVHFGAAGQFISGFGQYEMIGTSLTGTAPTNLFTTGGSFEDVVCRGCDLSLVTSNLVGNGGTGVWGSHYLFDSCKINASVTRYGTGSIANAQDVVELVNCYDGTNILNERYQPAGTLTTERTITRSSGATDDVGGFSFKIVTTANVDKYSNFFTTFGMDVENTLTGASHTATVEIVSSASLNNDDIWLELEYQGTASSPVASFGNTKPTTVLTSNAAVTTSSATWNSSPSTPVYQKLQVTFTPQLAGRVRGRVMVGKASTTVYVDPVITIT